MRSEILGILAALVSHIVNKKKFKLVWAITIAHNYLNPFKERMSAL